MEFDHVFRNIELSISGNCEYPNACLWNYLKFYHVWWNGPYLDKHARYGNLTNMGWINLCQAQPYVPISKIIKTSMFLELWIISTILQLRKVPNMYERFANTATKLLNIWRNSLERSSKADLPTNMKLSISAPRSTPVVTSLWVTWSDHRSHTHTQTHFQQIILVMVFFITVGSVGCQEAPLTLQCLSCAINCLPVTIIAWLFCKSNCSHL